MTDLLNEMARNRYKLIYDLLAGLPDREPKCLCQNNYLYNDIPYVDCPRHGVNHKTQLRKFSQ